MSLAQVRITRGEFDELYDHLTSHYPQYRNMHLRDSVPGRRTGTRRDLVHLHAMHAPPGPRRIIEAKISGPEVYTHYEIQLRSGVPQMSVFEDEGSIAVRKRIGDRFMREVQTRIREERALAVRFSENPSAGLKDTRLSGHYYLKRARGGIALDHPTCQAAVDERVLDESFLESLASWNLRLFRKA